MIDGVNVRMMRPEDRAALMRLAALDSGPIPFGAWLVAEVEGELWAALPLAGGRAVADPFRPDRRPGRAARDARRPDAGRLPRWTIRARSATVAGEERRP